MAIIPPSGRAVPNIERKLDCKKTRNGSVEKQFKLIFNTTTDQQVKGICL
jgi:hypothetical protein